MKTKAFLDLVGEMLTAQQDYFSAKRKGLGVMTQQSLLMKAKDLEKRVRVVLAQGSLEPDETTPTVHVHTTEQFQKMFGLDFTGTERPTDGKGENEQ